MKSELVPLVVFEEHHEAFIIWNYAIQKEWIEPRGNTLIHIDEHSDMGVPQFNKSIHDLNGNINHIKDFTYNELGIASFIVPAVYRNIISEVHWIRQKHNKPDPVHQEMFVRSYNRAGKKFYLGKMTDEFRAKSSCTTNDIVSFNYFFETIDQLLFSESDTLILDIDLDYFSCSGDPVIQNEIAIEITQSEYSLFNSNKYHPLHYIYINNIRTEKVNNRCFYIINDYNEVYPSELYVDQKTIRSRIDSFCEFLVKKNISPAIITLCRSYYSGYTPRDQCDYIQDELKSSLSSIFHVEKEKYIGQL
jgi:hypothetical protein